MIRISFHFSIRVYTGTAEGKNKIVRKQEGQPSAAFSDIISQVVMSIVIPILSLIIGLVYPPFVLAVLMVVVEIVFSICLYIESKRSQY